MSTEGSTSPCQMFFEGWSAIEANNGLNAGSSSAGDNGTPEHVEIPHISFLQQPSNSAAGHSTIKYTDFAIA